MSRFYQCEFEEDFCESDPWWKPGDCYVDPPPFPQSDVLTMIRIDERETVQHSKERLRGFLSYAFTTLDETCKSKPGDDIATRRDR